MGQASNAPEFAEPRVRRHVAAKSDYDSPLGDGIRSARPAPRRVPALFANVWERAREGK
jgi:hypothetical protein